MTPDEKVIELLEEIRSETSGTQLAVDVSVDTLGAKLDRVVEEIRETRFATLDAMTGSPRNYHWTLDYLENTLIPRWRIEDEATSEIMGTAS